MSREKKYTSIILKKQTLGEGDELITVFTKENGKMRLMAKSTKFAKSKLQYSLQSLFLVNLTVAGSNIPKIIGAELEETFSNIRESLSAVNIAVYAEELLLKFTPDEQENENLFFLFVTFFSFLSTNFKNEFVLQLGLAKFKILFLQSVGFALYADPGLLHSARNGIGFSSGMGSFIPTTNNSGIDLISVSVNTFELFLNLQKASFDQLLELSGNVEQLQILLSSFLHFQLEREIKSERYLTPPSQQSQNG